MMALDTAARQGLARGTGPTAGTVCPGARVRPFKDGVVSTGHPKRCFECRRKIHSTGNPGADDIFRTGPSRFSTPRSDALYHRWITQGNEVCNGPSSVAITEALESGAGRVESFVLPHSHRHLSPLLLLDPRARHRERRPETRGQRPLTRAMTAALVLLADPRRLRGTERRPVGPDRRGPT